MIKFHLLHDYGKWEDVEAIETSCFTGGAIIQTRVCKICNKRQLRKTNSVTSSGVGNVRAVLNAMLNKQNKE